MVFYWAAMTVLKTVALKAAKKAAKKVVWKAVVLVAEMAVR